ncbi:GAF domain-containing protein [Arenicella xantha]|uniref:GAF domain-containing protein n=1 Tax=Arenicella xantha TaxID=644221 RepID=A0A395JKW8_9GAMM|nr:GAF domain-containing protein [Arenicella xantha]RBP48352.1 GAF domain-containing protein [Arenicella xantha]
MSNASYSLLLKQVEALIESESDYIANTANISSLIYHGMERVNWVGFYFLRDDELVLGPFNGQPACTRIPVGKGVCGTAFASNKSMLVKDVHEFPGHIACDAASESEVVVPFKTATVSGVFDIDSPERARFTASEKEFFEAVVALLLKKL